jgi:predicted MFS family arabinose efflux permease
LAVNVAVNLATVSKVFPTDHAAVRWYVLLLLAAIYALNVADRMMMSTLIEPIKADFHLSDAGVGFLTGVPLAVTFVAAGVPLSILADRVSRRNLIALSLAGWSLLTAACGVTRSYSQLVAARLLVGLFAAGSTPSSQSLISDYFPWRRRAFALSVYALGVSAGAVIASSSGYLSAQWGWRNAFIILGLPGIAVAVVLFATVKEPARGRLDAHPEFHLASSFIATLKFARNQPALLHVFAGTTLFAMWEPGLLLWTPSFLVRSHHMNLKDAGGALLLMHGFGGTGALVATTVLMRKLADRDPRAVPWFLCLASMLGFLPSILAFAVSSRITALAMLWIFVPMSYVFFGPILGLVQNLVPPSMRAQAVALLLLCSNLADLIVAPMIVGLTSDALGRRFGTESLRVAMLPLTLLAPWIAWHFWMCSRRLSDGLAQAGNT